MIKFDDIIKLQNNDLCGDIMKEKAFLKDLEICLFYILKYGISNVDFDVDKEVIVKDKEKQVEFVKKVHKGFMLAQNLIIHNLLILSKERKKTQAQLKQMRAERASKDKLENVEESLKINKYQELSFRKVADSIVWQLLGQDLTIIKRLYHHNTNIDITNSNLDYDMEVINGIFESDMTKFPLLCDITSIIQTGDVLVKDYFNGRMELMELKDGKVNEEIERIINAFRETNCERMLYYELKDRDDKFHKQFDRYIKQQKKIFSTLQIINTGRGNDYSTGMNINIYDDVFFTKHFDDKIANMLDEVNVKNYSITVIDECLLVGVYSRKRIPIDSAFRAWKNGLGIKFPEVDIMASISSPLCYPIFLHPFSIDDKMRLIKGDKVIKLCLAIDKWLELMNGYGIKYRWLTKKETARHNSCPDYLKAFEVEGQAIEIEFDGVSSILYDGIFARMVFYFMTPLSAIEFLKHTLVDGKKLAEEKKSL